MPQIIMPYTVHLDHTLRVTPLNTLFCKGDSAAHRFVLTILSAGVQEDLTGCTVSGKFYRMADSTVVSVTGSVEDGKAVAVLKKACYDYIGRFALTIAIQKGEEEETTVFYGDGYMHGQRADTAITGEYIIYDINTLLEKIAEIDAATQAANTATQAANTATQAANTATGKANTAASAANTAATNANAAADAANAAAKDWGDSTAANSSKLGGKAPEYYLQPRNLLDNSDFRNPVNQRGQTIYTTNGYCIDRWENMRNSDEITLTDDGISFLSNKNSGGLYQYAEGKRIAGKTVTAAVKIKNNQYTGMHFGIRTPTWGIYASKNIPIGDSLIVVTATIPSDVTDNVPVNIWVNDNSVSHAFDLEWAALYEGSYTASTLPPYVPKGYAAELAECMRYYKAIKSTAVAYGTTVNDQTGGFITIDTGIAMYRTPSIIILGELGYLRAAGVSYQVTELAINRYDGSMATLKVTCGNSTVPPGNVCVLINTYLVMSADL